jgi:hypothetical protein
MLFSFAQRAEARESRYASSSQKDGSLKPSIPLAVPTVVSAIPDTLVDIDSVPINNYRDLNEVFWDPEDGDSLDFTIQRNSNPGLVTATIDAGSALDLSFAPGLNGIAMIVIRAGDSEALFVEDTLVVTVNRTVWRIKADGTGQAPTIQAGLNAAADGDTVLLMDGTYTGVGNINIDFGGKSILLTSENGPDVTIIDCQGNNRAFRIYSSEGPNTIISNLTLRNGNQANGASFQLQGTSPTITGNIIEGGNAAAAGGGIYFDGGGSPTIADNIFIGNSASEGGAIYCNGGSAIIQSNTFIENSATSGGAGLHLRNNSDAIVSNNIIAFGTQGPGILCESGSDPTISCSNIFGNAGGDSLCGTDGGGNISADPLFCNPLGSGIVTIFSTSPCAPANNSCGVLIGADSVACGGPMVVSAIPDTTVIDDSPPVDNYRDLNDVFMDVEDGSALKFTIQSNSNPAAVTASIDADSALDLSFTPRQSGTATIVIRAMDSDSIYGEDTFDITVLGVISVEAQRVWDSPIHPADSPQPMFLLSMINSTAVAETVTAVTFTNTSNGSGSQSDMDASFTPLTLSAKSGVGILPGGAPGPLSASFVTGKLIYQNLEAVIPANDTLTLIVAGGASLTARDGDILDFSLADSVDLSFSRSALVAGDWPMNPADEFPVDGMVAAQLALQSVEATTFSSGSINNLALDVLLPGNGYEADVLNRLNIINLGTAIDTVDVIQLKAWADDGNGFFDTGLDFHIGNFSFTGSRWELTGLSYPVPVNGLQLFITADISETVEEGASIRLSLPTVPDLGVGMDSGNDGPLDVAVSNPFNQTIVSSERVLLSAVPLAPRSVNPGAGEVLLMHLVATNNYGVSKQITQLDFSNGTVTQGGATQEELDGEVELIELRIDGNDNGILEDTAIDPVVGVSFFNSGKVSFTGLSWDLPPGSSRHIFLTVDISLYSARDGDVIDAFLSGAFDIDFSDGTSVIAAWPVSSDPQLLIDGVLAAQFTMDNISALTLAPGDGPILSMDIIIPANGYAADELNGFEVINLETADDSDISDMRLWRDGGDGQFSKGGGDDIEIGPLIWTDNAWKSPVLAEPLPASGMRLFVGATVSSSPTNSASIRLAVPMQGITVLSGNDGPIDAPVECAQSLLISSEPLLASITAYPEVSVVGQDVTVRMIARNVGSEQINNITPSALIALGNGGVNLQSGPQPPTFNLAIGAVDTFTWVYNSGTPGTVRWQGNCQGTGESSGLPRTALDASSNHHKIFAEAGNLALFPINSMPFMIGRGQSNVVPLSLTFTALGSGDASDVRVKNLTLRLEDEYGGGVVPSDLLSKVTISEGSSIYLVKTVLETTGAEVNLTFAAPALIPTSQSVTLGIRMDVLASTTIPNFKVVIQDSTWFEADNIINGAPVIISLQEGTYPIQTGLGRLVTSATELDVQPLPSSSQRVSFGQQDVSLLSLQLDNPGLDGLTTDAAVASIGLTVTDTNGAVIKAPGQVFESISVSNPGAGVFINRQLGVEDSTIISLALSPFASIPVNTPYDLIISADITPSAAAGVYRVRLADSVLFDARDEHTGLRIPVLYQTDPVEGGDIVVEVPADRLVARGMAQFPPAVTVGETGVKVLKVLLRHDGPAGTGRIRVDEITVNFQNELREPLVPATFIDRLTVERAGSAISSTSIIPTSGNQIVLSLPGILLEPGDTDTLDLCIDVSATAPEAFIELLINGDGIEAVDANILTSVMIAPENGAAFPLTSGLTHLLTPATELIVGLDSELPAALAAGGTGLHAAKISMINTAALGSGPIRIEYLKIRASAGDYTTIGIGGVAEKVRVYVDANLIGESAGLTVDSTTCCIRLLPPLELLPQVIQEFELIVDLHDDVGSQSIRFGIDGDDIGIIQPGSALLQIAVEARDGQAFPLWTDAGNFSALNLKKSFSNFPNPFAAGSEVTTFVYYLPATAKVTLKILTVRGETVTTVLQEVRRSAGLHQDNLWDGRNGRGNAVVNGVYIAELTAQYDNGGRARLFRKVAVLR